MFFEGRQLLKNLCRVMTVYAYLAVWARSPVELEGGDLLQIWHVASALWPYCVLAWRTPRGDGPGDGARRECTATRGTSRVETRARSAAIILASSFGARARCWLQSPTRNRHHRRRRGRAEPETRLERARGRVRALDRATAHGHVAPRALQTPYTPARSRARPRALTGAAHPPPPYIYTE